MFYILNRDFPLWEFLNQPVFDADAKFMSPSEFQYRHQVERLERCWSIACQDRDKYPYS
jgi:hypothetical protein